MRTPKLNKAAQFELMNEVITAAVEANTDLIKKNKGTDLTNILTAALSVHFAPKKGGSTAVKVNEAGEVYCNYFEDYFDESNFAKKMSKPDKETGERHEVFKANSKDAEKLIRAIKAMKVRIDRLVTIGIREHTITATQVQAILDVADVELAIKYHNLDDIPTIDAILIEAGL